MNINDINNLLFNPQWTSKLLHYFLSGVSTTKGKKIKFELIYLALPFIFDKEIILKLVVSNKKSSFSTLFKSPALKNCLVKKIYR